LWYNQVKGGIEMAERKYDKKPNGKNATGAPAMYKSVEEMQELIDAYFKDCDGYILRDKNDEVVFDKWGQPVYMDQKPYTVTGLALALGFKSRQALINYQGQDMFNDAITRAKLKIEDYANRRLYDKDGVQGAKFTLINNYVGYKDKQDVEHSGDMSVKIVDDIK
jgi:hypothetical protein